MDKADTGDKGFDDVDFLQGRDDEQLQVELGEELQALLGRFVGAASESLVDNHKAEGAGAHGAPLQTELIGKAGGKYRVGELLFLPSGFAS